MLFETELRFNIPFSFDPLILFFSVRIGKRKIEISNLGCVSRSTTIDEFRNPCRLPIIIEHGTLKRSFQAYFIKGTLQSRFYNRYQSSQSGKVLNDKI